PSPQQAQAQQTLTSYKNIVTGVRVNEQMGLILPGDPYVNADGSKANGLTGNRAVRRHSAAPALSGYIGPRLRVVRWDTLGRVPLAGRAGVALSGTPQRAKSIVRPPHTVNIASTATKGIATMRTLRTEKSTTPARRHLRRGVARPPGRRRAIEI